MKTWKQLTVPFALLSLISISVGCGGGASEKPEVVVRSEQQAASGGQQAQPTNGKAAPTGYGAFRGRVVVTGTVSQPALLVRKGDTSIKNADICAANEIPDESIVVNNGGLANVFIYLSRMPEGGKEQAGHEPTEQLVQDQKGCVFIPRAMVLRVGKPFLIKSNDPITHNTKVLTNVNQIINVTLDAGSEPVEEVYARPEPAPVRVECNIHNWMRAWHLPLDHPYGVVTADDGSFEIQDLPVGVHYFTIWHEGKILKSDYEVEIGKDGDVIQQTIEIEAAALAARGDAAAPSLSVSMKR